MKEFKGTPGRWIKRGDGIVAPGDIEVAVVVNFQDDDAMNADANLIAAAPELLEALQNLYSYHCNIHSLSSNDFHAGHPVRKANAAIAKALGETK